MKQEYSKFKDILKIYSYRFDKSLVNPYEKTLSVVLNNSFVHSSKTVINNYGEAEVYEEKFKPYKGKKINIKKHMEAVNGTHTKH